MDGDRYDVIIVGAGPAGVFAALEFVRSDSPRILLLEKGQALSKRKCPARQAYCVGCDPCAIMTGWGGAGAFSDGKLTLSSEVGGNLCDYMSGEELDTLIDYTDGLWLRFGASENVFGPDQAQIDEMTRKATLAEMRLVPMRIRHLGSDRAPKVLQAMYDHLMSRDVEIRTETEVVRVIAQEGEVQGVELADGTVCKSDSVIVAPGRDGAEWLAKQARALGIGLDTNAVDVGVRVETPAAVMEPLTEHFYEAKLIHYSRRFGDQVRTFCMNPYGEVTAESYGDIVTVNGHSYAEKRTGNTNFAVLVSVKFTNPFDDPIQYGTSIARLANLLGENIIVQRLGDLEAGRRSTESRMSRSIVKPTMSSATPGDLSFVLPYRQLTDIVEFLHALDDLAPGVVSPHTLLYGVEVKFYSSRLEVDSEFMTQVKGLYAIGDGAGITRGLMQSSASGVHVARAVLTQRA